MNDIAPGLPPIDDDDLLAGEFVLGVLDADARREAQRRIGADRDFAARVARWDAHFAPWLLRVDAVEPGAQVRRGDRVVVKTREGEVMAKVLHRQTPRTIDLVSLNPEHPNRSFEIDEIDWIARIIWASQ